MVNLLRNIGFMKTEPVRIFDPMASYNINLGKSAYWRGQFYRIVAIRNMGYVLATVNGRGVAVEKHTVNPPYSEVTIL